MAADPILVVIAGRALGRVFTLGPGTHVVGRGPQCNIQIDADSVSRQHAQLEVAENRTVTLTDLRSTGGTYVDGRKIREPVRLDDGQIIALGAQHLKLLTGDDALARFEEQERRVDALTGVANLRTVLAAAAAALDDPAARPLCLIAVGLDRFRRFNEEWGHLAGDDALATISRSLEKELPAGTTLGRSGGDRWLVVCPRLQRDDAFALAETLRATIERLPLSRPRTLAASVAVIAVADGSGGISEVAGELAAALAEAKRAGGNRVVARG